MCNTFKMVSSGMYGNVKVPNDIFNRLDSKMFISGCTDRIKYMCANLEETNHLKSLGIDIDDVICDWYKIELI